jgi:addiction module HigA family antidote
MKNAKTRKPTHPGEILLEDILKPLNLTISEAAKNLGVSRKTLSEIVNQKSGITPNMAVRIAYATNTSAESWIRMQGKYDLWLVMQEKINHIEKFPIAI